MSVPTCYHLNNIKEEIKMAGLFYTVNANATEEEKRQIAQTGVVPSHLKGAEDKQYIVVLKHIHGTCSYISDTEIDGEVLIETGRKNIFKKIESYLLYDIGNSDGEGFETSLEKSFVLVEGVDITKCISLYRFLNLCFNNYDSQLDPEILDRALVDETGNQDVLKEYNLNEAIASGFGSAGTLLNNNKEEE